MDVVADMHADPVPQPPERLGELATPMNPTVCASTVPVAERSFQWWLCPDRPA